MKVFTLLLVPALLVLAAGQSPVVSGPANGVPVPGEAIGTDGGIDTSSPGTEFDNATLSERNFCEQPVIAIRDCPRHCRDNVSCRQCCRVLTNEKKYKECVRSCNTTWAIVLVYDL
ncbi:MAG: hypothetical protein JXB13_15255 [Phycisphaerae bacterium]|nr:hypothetical protein [Phycisphaerae bacterium]